MGWEGFYDLGGRIEDSDRWTDVYGGISLWRDKWKNGLLSRCLTRIIFVRYVPATLIFRFTATVLSLSTRFLDSLGVPRLLISNVVLLYVKVLVRRSIVRIARPFFCPLTAKMG
ncbi:hypothetical protein BGY98DRAFT_1190671, partial [Russula aff. rugulosa BPL654]